MPTVIICVILAAAVFAILRKMVKDKRSGKSCSCGCSCSGCSGACHAHNQDS